MLTGEIKDWNLDAGERVLCIGNSRSYAKKTWKLFKCYNIVSGIGKYTVINSEFTEYWTTPAIFIPLSSTMKILYGVSDE